MGFDNNLVLIRKSKKMSQEELAFAVGVTRQTIYSWEAGSNSPTIQMLKRLADVLSVSTEQLLNGFDVDRFPKQLSTVLTTFQSNLDEDIRYAEVPNWYIGLNVGEETCFALYDDGIKDCSYHITVVNEIILHNEKGYEIQVKEFDASLNQTDTYSFLMKKENDEIFFMGKIYIQDGIKHIESHHDKSFLKNWGIDSKYIGQSVIYRNAKKYELEYNGKKQDSIMISYLNGNSFFEVFLNKAHQSLYWKRYDKGRKSKECINADGNTYGLFYTVATDRLICQ